MKTVSSNRKRELAVHFERSLEMSQKEGGGDGEPSELSRLKGQKKRKNRKKKKTRRRKNPSLPLVLLFSGRKSQDLLSKRWKE